MGLSPAGARNPFDIDRAAGALAVDAPLAHGRRLYVKADNRKSDV
jgi:hypothetical protein